MRPIQRLPVGAQHDAGDAGVAGQPAGAGGGDGGPGAEAGGGAAGRWVHEVGQVDGDDHVWLDGAQHRQRAGGQRVVAQLHQGIGLLLGAGAGVCGRPGGLQDRLDGGFELLRADLIELAAEGQRPVGMLGEDQRPAFGGVGFGPVGSRRVR